MNSTLNPKRTVAKLKLCVTAFDKLAEKAMKWIQK
jgi:hypothetical protein